MRLSTLFTAFWLYDKSNKFDEIHAAITNPQPREPAPVMFEGKIIPQYGLDLARQYAAKERVWRQDESKRQRRLAGAQKYGKYCGGNPFRIYHNNAVATTLWWMQGRKLFAETYDDGRTKGYAVYEGLYLDMKVYSIEEFRGHFGRWVGEDVPVTACVKPVVTQSDLFSLKPGPKRQRASILPPQLKPPSIPPVVGVRSPTCFAIDMASDKFCIQCRS